MKMENLMLDSSFELKIIDFGFSAPMDKNADKLLYTKLGTEGYMAPEIVYDVPYEGEQVDLWASAVILFTMVAAAPPFAEPTKTNPHFQCLTSKNYDRFWQAHCQGQPDGAAHFSPDFRDLMQRMFEVLPKDRPNLQ